jgi:hypothetical protein
MHAVPSRRGPSPQVWLTERAIRKRHYLEKDERILEWKQGKIRRWRVDGSDQPIPKFHGLEHIPLLRGVTSLSYSPRLLFFVATDRLAVTDLAFIVRIWRAAPRSLCVVYTSFDEKSSGGAVFIRWDSDEHEHFDELVGFADRIRMRARDRLAGFPAEWQERMKKRVSEITGSAGFELELALLNENSAEAVQLRPRTVVGMWLRAACLGMTEERDLLSLQLNGGGPGWNDDEPGVIEAASELAAHRYFGSQASTNQVTALAAQILDAERTGADRRRTVRKLPERAYVEAVLRYATGDHSAAVDIIRPSIALHVRSAFIFFVVMKLDIGFELDRLIRDAETLAGERGLRPPLATGTV